MQAKREVIWPRLVASKLLGKSMSSNHFVDDPSIEEALFDVPRSIQNLSPGCATRKDEKNIFGYKLFVSTWNVGGVAPSDDLNLESWLDTCNNPCDIYVLGFQEIVPLSLQNVLGAAESRISMKWNSLIRDALNNTKSILKKSVDTKVGEKQKIYPVEGDHYKHLYPQKFKCIITKQMVGIFITVWIRDGLRPFIRHPSVSCVGCGVMGCLGNKGSVSVRFLLHETSFCFVCCHLASGGKEGDEVHRNSNVAEIVSRTRFPHCPSLEIPRKILDHDRLVWLGDLNYRISTPEATTRSLIHKRDWDTLLENDQLKAELSEGRVFQRWKEGIIDFAPTYKYHPNSNKYYGCDQAKKGLKKRAPAWCDRILWQGKGFNQKLYSRGEWSLSDHKPVKAIFTVEVEEFRYAKALEKLFTSARIEIAANELDVLSAELSLSKGRSSFQV